MPLVPQRAKTRQKTKPRRRPAEPGVPCVKQACGAICPYYTPARPPGALCVKPGTELATYTQGPIYAPIPACPACLAPGAFLIRLNLGPVFYPTKRAPLREPFSNLADRTRRIREKHFYIPTIWSFVQDNCWDVSATRLIRVPV